MTDDVTRKDPYRLAMQFEKIGQDFYTTLAQVSGSTEVRALCAQLSKEEGDHYGTFQRLQQAGGRQAAALDNNAVFTLMKTHVLPMPGRVSAVAIHGKPDKAIDLALTMEHNAIAFYRDLMAIVPGHAGDIAKIIQEEQRHAHLLSDLLQAISSVAK